MSKYTFICEEESTPYSTAIESKKTVEFRADGLNDVLEQFESFLRAAGFHFEGVLDIVNLDEENQFTEIPLKDEETDNSIWNKIIQRHDEELTKKFTDDIFGEVYTSEESDIVLNLGAAQPALDLNFSFVSDNDTTKAHLNEEERCSICKIPKSLMKSEKCYDANCPKTSWLMDLDYKLASEK